MAADQKLNKKSMAIKWISGITVLICCIAVPLAIFFCGGINQIKYDRFINPEQDLKRFQPLHNLFFFYVGVDSAIGLSASLCLMVLVMDFLEDKFPDPAAPIQSTKKSGAIRKNWSPSLCSAITFVVLCYVFLIGLIVMTYTEETRPTRIKIRHHSHISPEEMRDFQELDMMSYCAAGVFLAALVLKTAFFCWLDGIFKGNQHSEGGGEGDAELV
ncbi:OLC1v1028491C1 [Oldenlandia corymbosa var. corymbosa]|uniref:OLC1v1028491C1 n=1 Tax=Oldenlandia corymbosa var. corymbosa TaxID=529605 RepID=A0AAV1CCE0_OLDCO|nr:OLC1v1028491C1 [Oldenlandia corymbosa var. corymbosa]